MIHYFSINIIFLSLSGFLIHSPSFGWFSVGGPVVSSEGRVSGEAVDSPPGEVKTSEASNTGAAVSELASVVIETFSCLNLFCSIADGSW